MAMMVEPGTPTAGTGMFAALVHWIIAQAVVKLSMLKDQLPGVLVPALCLGSQFQGPVLYHTSKKGRGVISQPSVVCPLYKFWQFFISVIPIGSKAWYRISCLINLSCSLSCLPHLFNESILELAYFCLILSFHYCLGR